MMIVWTTGTSLAETRETSRDVNKDTEEMASAKETWGIKAEDLHFGIFAIMKHARRTKHRFTNDLHYQGGKP